MTELPPTTISAGAEVRQELTDLGVSLTPAATLELIAPPQKGSTHPVVILDRVQDIEGTPEYCVHGYATCVSCSAYCYLGNVTAQVVSDRVALPMCMPCAKIQASPDALAVKNCHDNLRSEGPHEHG